MPAPGFRADRSWATPISMSVIVLVLDDSIHTVVRSPEELVSVVTAIGASFRQHFQLTKQNTPDF
jgi:hypothetical protein